MKKAHTAIDLPAGMLSDNGIKSYYKKGIDIYSDPKEGVEFDLDKQLHVGSVDLRFRHLCKRFHLDNHAVLSYELLKDHNYTQPFELSSHEKLRIEPGEIILTTTLETVVLSKDFAAIVTGRSSIARLGVMIHCCQEFIHPGHGQPIPLQIINLGPYPVELDISVPICQIVFFKLSSSASIKYTDREDAKYVNEVEAQNSKIYEELNIINSRSTEKELSRKPTTRVSIARKFIRKYISPFLPSCISVLVITPFLTKHIANKTWTEVFSAMDKFTFPFFVTFFLLLLFVFSKRGNEE